MFGTNPVTSPFRDPEHLSIVSLFPTLQGEGPDAGRPAIFLRLAKCNLRCWFCDTQFDTGHLHQQAELAEEIIRSAHWVHAKLLVITGGEPLLQDFIPLVVAVNKSGITAAIETAGTLYLDGLSILFRPDRSIAGNIVVCSPKTPKLDPDLIPAVGAWKYIIKAGEVDPDDGLPMRSTQLPGEYAPVYRPQRNHPAPIYVQPMDEGDPEANAANLAEAVRASLKYGYRLSLQLHKIAGLD